MVSDKTDRPRLIEVAFPLKQASMDSVHEKNVRHGHISTLHIWPARRPLAASRAALIATLLPDPGDDEERKLILEKLGGRIVEKPKRKKRPGGGYVEELKEETEGGILHWGRESESDLDWFREKIREAYGGRSPKVLDPFAGGGAIPLEAMRLGCETTAVDINPVAWFILKCALEYPQKLAGQTYPLPEFVLKDREFMEAYFKGQGSKGVHLREQLKNINLGDNPMPPLPGMEDEKTTLEADLAWHVRAWGWWVLREARRGLVNFYPTYAEFEPLVEVSHVWEQRPMQLVPIDTNDIPDITQLNAEFSDQYLKNKNNPRWVAKPTAAYLWARTVICKNCRSIIPLLKTRWLVKKSNKRVLLTMSPNNEKTGMVFGIQTNVAQAKGSPSERRDYDNKIGGGTMSRSGATCPSCKEAIMTMEDIRLEGQTGQLGTIMVAVVVSGRKGKEYRLPSELENQLAEEAKERVENIYLEVPFGLPDESTPAGGGSGAGRAFALHGYGLMKWRDLFTHKQKLAIGTFISILLESRTQMKDRGYTSVWIEGINAYLAMALDFVINRNSNICTWTITRETIRGTFARFALPVSWDFAEANLLEKGSGGFPGAINWISRYLTHTANFSTTSEIPKAICQSSISASFELHDIIVTDPPYYDAIPYSDLMDFFYIWLKRSLFGINPEIDNVFSEISSPKWDNNSNDGELIDDESRFGGDKIKSKISYEEGMFRVFKNCFNSLRPDGRMVIVFANKQPDAWETLVSAVIRAGFMVNGSWPIQTEMRNRTRALSSAALSSSVWLVCKKRIEASKPGWDNRVLEEMRQKITSRLRDFWDAGIRGPDFVWAATGPALEAYSQYPAVKKANEPGQLMSVGEFLGHVRRIVVDFVVGRVLSGDGGSEAVSGLDNPTTYYLLHRHDFGFEDAPAGACILYSISCGLSDRDLTDKYSLLTTAGKPRRKADEDSGEIEYEESSGSTFRLKGWKERKTSVLWKDTKLEKGSSRLPLFPDMETSVSPTREVPLIDHAHRLMQLWKAGDINQIEDHLDIYGLRRNQLFHKLLQALIELATVGSEERSLLESISNHLGVRGKEIPQLF